MAVVPLQSGLEWEEDPVGSAADHGGRTITWDIRATDDPLVRAVAKRPKPGRPQEMYSVGMERVAYHLGAILGIRIPGTHLEIVGGHRASVQMRVRNARSWVSLDWAPSMRDNITDTELWPLAGMFDVWMGNTDRRSVNLLFEPLPPGATPGQARGCQTWFIDHGQCGLWPAWKIDAGRGPYDIPDDPQDVRGELSPEGEVAIGERMEPEYRMALKHCTGDARQQCLDRVRAIDDDAIDQAIEEVPEDYFSAGRARATAQLLKARRDALDTVLSQYW